MSEEEKLGIMTDSERDKAIMELMTELRITNTELQHTNTNINKIIDCYNEQGKDIKDIKEKIIPPIQDKLSSHGVWIKILSTAVLGAISAYVANLFRNGK